MTKSTATFLMFDGTAEDALNLYASVFQNMKADPIERYGPGDQGPEGKVQRGGFTLNGQRFMIFDTPIKHAFGFTPAISIFVECESEAELDAAFEKLGEGGQALMPLDDYGFSRKFGWLQDRFGVSWQLNLV